MLTLLELMYRDTGSTPKQKILVTANDHHSGQHAANDPKGETYQKYLDVLKEWKMFVHASVKCAPCDFVATDNSRWPKLRRAIEDGIMDWHIHSHQTNSCGVGIAGTDGTYNKGWTYDYPAASDTATLRSLYNKMVGTCAHPDSMGLPINGYNPNRITPAGGQITNWSLKVLADIGCKIADVGLTLPTGASPADRIYHNESPFPVSVRGTNNTKRIWVARTQSLPHSASWGQFKIDMGGSGISDAYAVWAWMQNVAIGAFDRGYANFWHSELCMDMLPTNAYWLYMMKKYGEYVAQFPTIMAWERRTPQVERSTNYSTLDPYANELLPTPLAFDYRFEFVTAQTKFDEGYRDLVVSWKQNDTPLARAQMDIFRSLGGRLWITIEPSVRTSQADWDVKSGYPSENALWDLAAANNAWLRADSVGHAEFGNIRHPFPEFWSTFKTRGLDFSVLPFADAWADWIHSRWPDIHGVYHDYGFPDDGLSWVNGYTEADGMRWRGNWYNWAVGYKRAFDRERALWPNRELLLGQYGSDAVLNPSIKPRATGVILEGIGNVETPSFFTYQKAWQICREAKAVGLRPMLWCLFGGSPTPPTAEALRNRRAIACMAVATRGFMEWRWGDPLGGVHLWPSHRIPELMNMSIGTVDKAAVELTTDVWRAVGTRGYVIINLSASPYVYEGRSVAANDGLMVQTRAVGGAPLLAQVTNEGL
jgi:hypothetical protein